jgi:hypothetical protein
MLLGRPTSVTIRSTRWFWASNTFNAEGPSRGAEQAVVVLGQHFGDQQAHGGVVVDHQRRLANAVPPLIVSR